MVGRESAYKLYRGAPLSKMVLIPGPGIPMIPFWVAKSEMSALYFSLYGSFLFVSILEGEQGWVRGRGGGGKILEEALLRGFEGVLGGGSQVGDHKRSRQVPEELWSFWARNDRPILGTMTSEKWPHQN